MRGFEMQLLALGAAMIAIIAAAPAGAPASRGAAEPAGKPRQAPGFYRFELGKLEITALLDGAHGFPAKDLAVGVKDGEVEELLRRQYLASPVAGMINAILVKTPDKLVLIDTGAGDLYGKDGGLLLGNLRAAGYDPSQVDEIYLTHLHRDHVGGPMMGGKAVYPKGIGHVSRLGDDAFAWVLANYSLNR
jgi:glyoxylase-like metal-dependent hydrolase (beta-lactamase superfamily II)